MPNPHSTQKRIKICFIGLYAYPLFNPHCISPFGGSEVRVSLLAKELARRGNVDVNLITFDHGQLHIEMRDGIRIISWTGWQCPDAISLPDINTNVTKNKPLLFPIRKIIKLILTAAIRSRQEIKDRLITFGQIETHSIPHSRIAIYEEADSDIYIIPGNSDMSAELAYYCKNKGKKVVLLAGSDIDLDPDIKSNQLYETRSGVSGFLMRYTIYHVDTLILQTEYQRALLREHFQRDGLVIRNPMDLTQKFPPGNHSKVVLWVGKSDQIKRPELALDLVEEFAEYVFTLIMSFSNEKIHNDIFARAKSLPNVTILPYIPYEQVEEIYAKASLLVNTSIFEGFPNTFLQAAKYGVPILSLNVDPDGMLTEHDCGRYCKGDFETMKSALAELMTKSVHDRLGANGLEYVHKYHDKTIIGRQFEETLLSLFDL